MQRKILVFAIDFSSAKPFVVDVAIWAVAMSSFGLWSLDGL